VFPSCVNLSLFQVLLAIAAVLVILFAAVFGVAFNSIAEEVSKQSGGKYNGAEVAATGGIVIVVVGGLNVLINLILNVVLTYGINKVQYPPLGLIFNLDGVFDSSGVAWALQSLGHSSTYILGDTTAGHSHWVGHG